MNTEQLIASLSEEAVPVAPVMSPMARGLRWLVGMTVYIVVLSYISGLRPDLAARFSSPLYIAEMMALYGITITTAFSAALLSFPDLYQKRWLALSPIALFVLFAVVVAVAFQAGNPPAPTPIHDMECTICIMLYAMIPAIWLLRSMRRNASTHATIAGSVAALAAFSTGAIILRLIEETDSIPHLVQFHYAPMAGFALIGMLVGRAMLKW